MRQAQASPALRALPGNSDMGEDLLTVEDVAGHLACSNRFVYRLLDRGELPYVSLGAARGYRVRPADLREYIERQTVRPGC